MRKKSLYQLDELIISNQPIFFTLRIITAYAVIAIISYIFNIPYGYWGIITASFVMTTNYSSLIWDKAKQRAIGTIGGAITGVLISLLPHNSSAQYVITWVCFAIFAYFSIVGSYKYGGVIAAVTLTIIVFPNHNGLYVGLWRAFNIILGGLISVIVGMYIFPSKARVQFKILFREFLKNSAILYYYDTFRVEKNELTTQKYMLMLNSFKKIQALQADMIVDGSLSPSELDSIIIGCNRILNLISNQVLGFSKEVITLENSDLYLETLEYKKHIMHHLVGIYSSIKHNTPFDYEKSPIIHKKSLSREISYNVENESKYLNTYGYTWLIIELHKHMMVFSHEYLKISKNKRFIDFDDKSTRFYAFMFFIIHKIQFFTHKSTDFLTKYIE
ncbi:MAG: FUSC family protein [Psittacicella sp.]